VVECQWMNSLSQSLPSPRRHGFPALECGAPVSPSSECFLDAPREKVSKEHTTELLGMERKQVYLHACPAAWWKFRTSCLEVASVRTLQGRDPTAPLIMPSDLGICQSLDWPLTMTGTSTNSSSECLELTYQRRVIHPITSTRKHCLP
jgi:hypothetical protein